MSWSTATRQERLAYFAGFFDGEGCVALYAQGGRANRYMIRFAVTNTNRAVIDRLHGEFGGRIVDKAKYRQKPHHKPSWDLVWRQGSDLPALLQEVTPFLVLKRRQAEAVLLFLADIARRKTTRWVPLTEREASYRKNLADSVAALNQRGAPGVIVAESVAPLDATGLPVRLRLWYLAGMLDAEGTVTVHRMPKPSARSGYQYVVYVGISSTSIAHLRVLQEWFGGRISHQVASSREYHKARYTLQLRRKDGVVDLIRLLQPIVQVKKPQAGLALLMYASLDAHTKLGRNGLDGQTLAERIDLREQMLVLNDR